MENMVKKVAQNPVLKSLLQALSPGAALALDAAGGKVSLGRANAGPAENYGEALAGMRQTVPGLLGDARGWLDQRLKAARAAIDVASKVTGADNADADALKRLLALIDAMIEKRKEAGLAIAKSLFEN